VKLRDSFNLRRVFAAGALNQGCLVVTTPGREQQQQR
jgi:hypothetical protein